MSISSPSRSPSSSGIGKRSTSPVPAPHVTPSVAELYEVVRKSVEDEEPSTDTVNDLEMDAKPLDKFAMVLAVAVPLVGFAVAMAVLWQFGWVGWMYVGLMVGGWMVSELGITVGFHRLLSHRSFQTFRWVKALWMGLGALAVQGSPLVWCAIHRRHHAHSDHHGDPHSPHLHGGGFKGALLGAWHSHTGWLFTGFWSYPKLERYVPDLLSDKMLVAVDRVYYMWVAASLTIPAVIAGALTGTWWGAFLGFLWGGLARVFVSHHITWSINSICHLFGSREYRSNDLSRNNLLFGFLAQGEGWHNNHHAFPASARHGLKWWQFDMSWYVIRTMQACGLAWNVKLPTQRELESKRL